MRKPPRNRGIISIVNDTDPRIQSKWIERLRALGPSKRSQMASHLSNQNRWRMRNTIRRRFPNLSETERELKLIEFCYGSELAERIRRHLDERLNS